jgi:hypothetical protein
VTEHDTLPRVSTRLHAILYRPAKFDLAVLKRLLAGAAPVDRMECFQHAELRRDLHAALYTPPAKPSPKGGWGYGLEYFDETLSGQLIDAIAGSPQEVVLFAWDDSRGCEWTWRLGPGGDDRRYIMGDGVGVAERTDAHGEQVTSTASIRVGDDVADVDAAQALLAAPYAAEPVLQAAFGIGIEPLLGLLAKARWELIWPARAAGLPAKPAAKKPAAKKPAAKKPAAKKPATKKPAAKKPAAKKPAAKKPAAKKPAAKKPAPRSIAKR